MFYKKNQRCYKRFIYENGNPKTQQKLYKYSSYEND